MSLINDALKRANQTQRERSSLGPIGVPLQVVTTSRKGHGGLVLAGGIFLCALGGLALVYSGWQRMQLAQSTQGEASLPQPAVIQPTVAQPTVAQPPVAQPPVAQPTVAQPPVVQPPVVQPPVVQPPVVQPTVVQPTVVQTKVISTAGAIAASPKPTAAVSQPAQKLSDLPIADPSRYPARTSSPTTTVQRVVVQVAEPAVLENANLRLQAIFYIKSRPSALINGKKVYNGSEFGEVRVVQIKPTSVVLKVGETLTELSL